MKNRKRYGRKIKHSRTNLYRRKKTRGEKIAGTVLLVIVALAIAFLGYCLGKPVLEFFEKNANREEPEWLPPVQSSSAETSALPADQPVPEETAETTAQPAAEPSAKMHAITAPGPALQNTASLSAFAAKAKNDGYNAVVLEMKDESGYLRYASEAASSRGDELVKASMSASEIASVLQGAGLYPIGTVCVLTDNAGCAADPDMSYKIVDDAAMSWLDYSKGVPVRWANPASDATRSYNAEIVSELTEAGFAVILKELVFPELHPYDRQFLSSVYFEDNRSAMLLPFVPANTPVEMLAEDIIGENPSKTAEILRERDFTYGDGNMIAVRISRKAFSPENGYPADAAGLVKDVLARVKAKTGTLAVIPLIESSGFSEAELSAVKELLDGKEYIVE